MGKGDLKTKRGKIVKGSYGKKRPRKKPSRTRIEKAEETNTEKE